MNSGILTRFLRSGLILGAASIFVLPQSALALPDIKLGPYDSTNKGVTPEGGSFDPGSSALYIDGTPVALQSVTATRITSVPILQKDRTHELLLMDSMGDDIHMLAGSVKSAWPGRREWFVGGVWSGRFERGCESRRTAGSCW